jgi:hypothetical protein
MRVDEHREPALGLVCFDEAQVRLLASRVGRWEGARCPSWGAVLSRSKSLVGAKELLRELLACTTTGGMRYDVSAALYRFYAFCAATTVPEIHDLAETIETWQAPTILAITTGLSNARSEGYNRIIKHVGTGSSNTSAASRSASATPTTSAAEYGGPAPANHGRRHPGPDSSSPAKSEEPVKVGIRWLFLRVGPHRRPCAAWVFVVAAPGRVLGGVVLSGTPTWRADPIERE